MDFLKDILGEDLYGQVATKINAHNGDEANKDKLIKLANLATGKYVGKDKYSNLEALLGSKDEELKTANALIDDLKKQGNASEELKSKITDYEAQIAQITAQREKDRIEFALKYAVLDAKAKDPDYLVYKIKTAFEKDSKMFEVDDQGNIKGIDNIIKGYKTSMPDMFVSESTNVLPNPLPTNNNDQKGPVVNSLADALKERYTKEG